MCQVFICTKKGTAVDWHLLKVPEINDNIDELCLTVTEIGDDTFSNRGCYRGISNQLTIVSKSYQSTNDAEHLQPSKP